MKINKNSENNTSSDTNSAEDQSSGSESSENRTSEKTGSTSNGSSKSEKLTDDNSENDNLAGGSSPERQNLEDGPSGNSDLDDENSTSKNSDDNSDEDAPEEHIEDITSDRKSLNSESEIEISESYTTWREKKEILSNTSEKDDSDDLPDWQKMVPNNRKSPNDLNYEKFKIQNNIGQRKSNSTSSDDEIIKARALRNENRAKRKNRKGATKIKVAEKPKMSLPVRIPLRLLSPEKENLYTNMYKANLKQYTLNKDDEDTSSKDTTSSESSSSGSYNCNFDHNDDKMEH